MSRNLYVCSTYKGERVFGYQIEPFFSVNERVTINCGVEWKRKEGNDSELHENGFQL